MARARRFERATNRPLAEARPEIDRPARAVIYRVRQTGRSETIRDLILELTNYQTVAFDLTFVLQSRDRTLTRDAVFFAVDVTDRLAVDSERDHVLRQLTFERRWLQAVIERSPEGIVEAHGGQISVESVPDQFTAFRFSRPLASAADETAQL